MALRELSSRLRDIFQARSDKTMFVKASGTVLYGRVVNAMDIILEDKSVKSILFNIFGGITRCDDVARGLKTAFEQAGGLQIPVVVRLTGTTLKPLAL